MAKKYWHHDFRRHALIRELHIDNILALSFFLITTLSPKINVKDPLKLKIILF